MEKLQKYNQRLLAIAGTAIAVLLVFILLITSYLILRELFENSGFNVEDHSLIAEPAKPDDGTLLISQDVSFENLQLIDTINEIYLIPVRQVNLEKSETIYKTDRLVKQESVSSARHYKKSFHYYGPYNNIMVYNAKQETKDFLFNKKIFISALDITEIADEMLMFITASATDTNHDGKLNYDDLNSLYIYRFSDKKLTEISLEGMSFSHYHILISEKAAITQWYEDKNEDGTIQTLKEPLRLKSLDLNDFNITDFVPEDEILKLKKLIN